MKANVLFGINDLRYVDVLMPTLKPGEVLLKVRAAGICGSDVARVFQTGTYHFPTIIGHEFAGEVCDVNETDNRYWLGKRVAVFPLKPCFQCENCRQGHYELCDHYDYLGSRCDGGFAEYVAVPVWNLLELPAGIDFESAAMMEPASVAMHALAQSRFKSGDTVAVIGPGTIGLILCKLALLSGAERVFLVGRTPRKLEFARQYGIEDVGNSITDDVKQWIDQQTGGKGVNILFEGTGASLSLELCLDLVKSSGTIVALGNPSGDISLPKTSYWKLLRKQLSVYGTWNSRFGTRESDWEKMKNLLQKRELDIRPLITHRLPLEKLGEGLEIMRNPEIYSNKIILLNE